MTTIEHQPRPSLRSELAGAGRQVRELLLSSLSSWRHPRTTRWWQPMVALMWAAGIAGDAYTTLAMMATGYFEESNPIAIVGMGAVGPVGYTAIVSLTCVVMTLAATGRPRGRYATLVWALMVLAGVLKLYTSVSNALLWAAL